MSAMDSTSSVSPADKGSVKVTANKTRGERPTVKPKPKIPTKPAVSKNSFSGSRPVVSLTDCSGEVSVSSKGNGVPPQAHPPDTGGLVSSNQDAVPVVKTRPIPKKRISLMSKPGARTDSQTIVTPCGDIVNTRADETKTSVLQLGNDATTDNPKTHKSCGVVTEVINEDITGLTSGFDKSIELSCGFDGSHLDSVKELTNVDPIVSSAVPGQEVPPCPCEVTGSQVTVLSVDEVVDSDELVDSDNHKDLTDAHCGAQTQNNPTLAPDRGTEILKCEEPRVLETPQNTQRNNHPEPAAREYNGVSDCESQRVEVSHICSDEEGKSSDSNNQDNHKGVDTETVDTKSQKRFTVIKAGRHKKETVDENNSSSGESEKVREAVCFVDKTPQNRQVCRSRSYEKAVDDFTEESPYEDVNVRCSEVEDRPAYQEVFTKSPYEDVNVTHSEVEDRPAHQEVFTTDPTPPRPPPARRAPPPPAARPPAPTRPAPQRPAPCPPTKPTEQVTPQVAVVTQNAVTTSVVTIVDGSPNNTANVGKSSEKRRSKSTFYDDEVQYTYVDVNEEDMAAKKEEKVLRKSRFSVGKLFRRKSDKRSSTHSNSSTNSEDDVEAIKTHKKKSTFYFAVDTSENVQTDATSCGSGPSEVPPNFTEKDMQPASIMSPSCTEGVNPCATEVSKKPPDDVKFKKSPRPSPRNLYQNKDAIDKQRLFGDIDAANCPKPPPRRKKSRRHCDENDYIIPDSLSQEDTEEDKGDGDYVEMDMSNGSSVEVTTEEEGTMPPSLPPSLPPKAKTFTSDESSESESVTRPPLPDKQVMKSSKDESSAGEEQVFTLKQRGSECVFEEMGFKGPNDERTNTLKADVGDGADTQVHTLTPDTSPCIMEQLEFKDSGDERNNTLRAEPQLEDHHTRTYSDSSVSSRASTSTTSSDDYIYPHGHGTRNDTEYSIPKPQPRNIDTNDDYLKNDSDYSVPNSQPRCINASDDHLKSDSEYSIPKSLPLNINPNEDDMKDDSEYSIPKSQPANIGPPLLKPKQRTAVEEEELYVNNDPSEAPASLSCKDNFPEGEYTSCALTNDDTESCGTSSDVSDQPLNRSSSCSELPQMLKSTSPVAESSDRTVNPSMSLPNISQQMKLAPGLEASASFSSTTSGISTASSVYTDSDYSEQEDVTPTKQDTCAQAPGVHQLPKKKSKVYYIAREIMTSEEAFVKVLRLLNVDFRKRVTALSKHLGHPVVPPATLGNILRYLPELTKLNEDILMDIRRRVQHWDTNPRIADIFIKKGPFLKLYTSYIREFESMNSTLADARRRYPNFDALVKEFEASPLCASLELKHYMLKPVQRIPQYRLLLQDYKRKLTEQSPDYKDIDTALAIVSEVADHANQSMKYGDCVKKLLEIQNSLVGHYEVITAGQYFIKEGILMKLSRKEMQPRKFFLLSDVLLYTTPIGNGNFKLNNALVLTGMKVNKPSKEDFQNEFSIITTQRSFTLSAKTPEERSEWLRILQMAIADNISKRQSFYVNNMQDPSIVSLDVDQDFKLGSRAPVWIPDARVSMCMLCTTEFSITFRRHHCRACGKVICGSCSGYRAPLRYLAYEPTRVCLQCFQQLAQELENMEDLPGDDTDLPPDHITPVSDTATSPVDTTYSKASIRSRFRGVHFGSFGRGNKKKQRSGVLQEIKANDENVDLSGYLKMWRGNKWKKIWVVLKGKVLYTFKASEDTAAIDSRVLLGYEVKAFHHWFQGVEPILVFEICHKGTASIILRTESQTSRDRWIKAIQDASVP